METDAGLQRTRQGRADFTTFDELEDGEKTMMAEWVATRIGFSDCHADFDWGPHREQLLCPIKTMSNYHCDGIKSLYLFGEVGAGKTVLLANMVKNLYTTWAHGRNCRSEATVPAFVRNVIFVTHQTFVDILHDSKLERFSIGLDELGRSPYLIVDDFGAAYETEYSKGAFESMIDYRWRFGLPTWITSNVKMSTLQLDKTIRRTASRLSDRKWMAYAEMKGNLRNPK